MSWRLLFFTLLILAGVATVGGLYAGDWLIEHAPRQANLPDFTKDEPAPRVGLDGVPVLRHPPQPLMNGTVGIPEQEVNVNWQISPENPSLAATTPLSSGDNSYQPTYGNATRGISSGGSTSQTIKTRPIGSNRTPTTTGSTHWEAPFRREMASCRELGFFERANCIAHVRDKYCGGYQAWGQINDCPSR